MEQGRSSDPAAGHRTPNGGRLDDRSMGELLKTLSDQTTTLVREEIELAKAEVTEKVSVLIRGAVVGIVAGIFAVIGLLFLLHGLAWLVWFVLFSGSSNYFWGFFIVAGVLFLLGALAGFLATRAFKKGSPPTPQLAIDEAKRIRETVQSEHPEQTI